MLPTSIPRFTAPMDLTEPAPAPSPDARTCTIALYMRPQRGRARWPSCHPHFRHRLRCGCLCSRHRRCVREGVCQLPQVWRETPLHQVPEGGVLQPRLPGGGDGRGACIAGRGTISMSCASLALWVLAALPRVHALCCDCMCCMPTVAAACTTHSQCVCPCRVAAFWGIC